MIDCIYKYMEEDLRQILHLLKKLRSAELIGQGRSIDEKVDSIQSSIVKLKSNHLIELSEVLFKELVTQFRSLRSFLRCRSNGGVGMSKLKTKITQEGFIVLLRCCLMMVPLLEFNMSFLWEKCKVILEILGKFCPQKLLQIPHNRTLRSARHSSSQCCINGKVDTLLNLFLPIAEVFMVEFSENVGLRKHLICVNTLSATSNKFCACSNTNTANCSVLNLLFSHFLQLARTDMDFIELLHSSSFSNDKDKMIPEISLNDSLKLISAPLLLSSSLIFQAQMILLASIKLDAAMNSFIFNPFELSTNLYLSYLSAMQCDDAALGGSGRSSLGAIAPPSYSGGHEFIYQNDDFVDSSHFHSEDLFFGTKAEVLAYSTDHIRGSHSLIDQLCKEATCLVVDFMLENNFPRKLWEQRHDENRPKIRQESCCVAAAIRLMNSSLLNVLRLLKQKGSFNEKKAALGDFSAFTATERFSQWTGMIRTSGCGADEQIQNFLCSMLGYCGGIHEEIKFMLAHFSSLLVFSYKRKLGFLWKGCISIMMTLMNLLLFEETNMGLSNIFKLLQSHPIIDYKGLLAYRSTSVIIAKNFEKSRMVYLNKNKYALKESRGVNESEAIKCNVECFIKHIPCYHRNPSEWKDLMDFIECTPRKDYSLWLKNRKKFDHWKQKKSTVFKSKKKKRRTNLKTAYDLHAKDRFPQQLFNKITKAGGQENRVLKALGACQTLGISNVEYLL